MRDLHRATMCVRQTRTINAALAALVFLLRLGLLLLLPVVAAVRPGGWVTVLARAPTARLSCHSRRCTPAFVSASLRPDGENEAARLVVALWESGGLTRVLGDDS
jgi:hypothetical protein